MYVYMCTSGTYIHTYIHVYIHTYIRVYIKVRTRKLMEKYFTTPVFESEIGCRCHG
jgi:hypothetical protein